MQTAIFAAFVAVVSLDSRGSSLDPLLDVTSKYRLSGRCSLAVVFLVVMIKLDPLESLRREGHLTIEPSTESGSAANETG